MNNKKLIVIIDDMSEVLETTGMILEEKGFEVKKFLKFDDALEFLKTRTPELIISDLVGHDDMNGVEFYVNNIMSQKINFALWSGSVDITPGNKGGLSLFFEGMPKDYSVTYNPIEALNQDQVELIIHDFKQNRKASFPTFSKSDGIKNVLNYFNL